MYHGVVSTFAFGDGHADKHKWLDGNIIKWGKLAAAGQNFIGWGGPTDPNGADAAYVVFNYRFPAKD